MRRIRVVSVSIICSVVLQVLASAGLAPPAHAAATPIVPTDLLVEPCEAPCSPNAVTSSTEPILSAKINAFGGGLTGTIQVREASSDLLVAEQTQLPLGESGSRFWAYAPPGALANKSTYEFRAGTTDNSTAAWSPWSTFSVETDAPEATPTKSALDQQHRASGTVLRIVGDGDDPGPGVPCDPTPSDLCSTLWLKYQAGELLVSLVPLGTRAVVSPHGVARIERNVAATVDPNYNQNSCDGAGNYCYTVSEDGKTLYRKRTSTNTQEAVWTDESEDADDPCSGVRYAVSDGAGNGYFMGHLCTGNVKQPIYKYDPRTDAVTYIGGNPTARERKLGTPLQAYTLENVHGMAMDGGGNLLISEARFGHVLMVTGLGDMNPPVPEEQTYGGCGTSSAGINPTACLSDPVNTATGAFTHTETDLHMSGLGTNFSLSRNYTSADPRVGHFGRGWSSNLDAKLTLTGTATAPTAVTFTDTTGQRLQFKNVQSRYVGAPGVLATLRKRPDGWEVRRRDESILRFDTTGRLTALLDRNATGLSLQYANGNLDTVTDASGRIIDIQTSATGRITTIALPDGRQTTYTYTSDRLDTATDPRGGTTRYEYNADSLLTRITDRRGNDLIRNEYGADERVTKQLDSLGNPTTFTWDPQQQVATMTDAAGGTWTDRYADNALMSRTDPLDHTTSYRYDTKLNLITRIDPRGKRTMMAYDSRANLVRQTSPTGAIRSATYDGNNRLLAEVDPRGNATRYRYDAAGNLLEITDAQGGSTTYDRDPARPQLVVGKTDSRGNRASYGYDSHGNLTTLTSATGATTKYQYDATGRQTGIIAPRGNTPGVDPVPHTTTLTYDANDNLTSTETALGRTTSQEYDANNNLVKRTDPAGNVSTFTYNEANEQTRIETPNGARTNKYTERGELAETTDETGARTTYAYDKARHLKKVVTPRGNQDGATAADFTTTYERDAAGNVLTRTEPGNRVTTYEYDADGRLTTIVDPLSRRTAHKYDDAANLISTIDPAQGEWKYTYNKLGRLTSETNPLGQKTEHAYDPNGNETTLTDPAGNTERRTYDADNRLGSIVSPRGTAAGANPDDFRTTFEYDPNANLVAVNDPLSNTIRYTYDRDNNQTSATDARGKTTDFDLDQLNRIIKTTDPTGAVTKYEYNTTGHLTARVDPNGGRTEIEHDPLGRETARTDPLGNRRTSAYDANGNLIRTTSAEANASSDPAARRVNLEYDTADRLTAVNYPDATPDVRYEYDQADNRTKMTEVPAAGCGLLGCPAQTYSYNARDELTKVTRALASFTYAYDAAGRLTTRQQPGGAAVTYTYDSAGRALSASIGDAKTTYGWDADSNLLTTTQPNGVSESRSYDRAGRVATITTTNGATQLAKLTYERNPVGAPTKVTSPNETAVFDYDARGQLTGACYANNPCTPNQYRYTYDPAGNLLTKTDPAAATTYTYDAAGQLKNSTTGTVRTDYSYDADGNLLTAGARTFTYDAAGQLATTTQAGSKVTYSYDGDGLRVKAVTGSGLTATTDTLTWDTNAPLPQLASSAKGLTTTRYYYGESLIRQTAGNTNTYFLQDDLNSVVGTISDAGALQRTIAYDPFGNNRAETATPSTAPNTSLRFNSQLLDETGRYYLRARTYDPATARFDSRDPLDPLAGETALSPYAYANNSPTSLTDPSGLRPDYDSGCTGAMLAGYYDPFTFGLASKTVDRIAGIFGGGLDPRCTDAGRIVGGLTSLLALPAAIKSGGVRSTPTASATNTGARSLPELRAAADATIPSNMTRSQWGEMVWGAGGRGGAAATNARALIGRSADELAQIPGLTLRSAIAWRDFYRQAVIDGRGVANPANATNQARVELLNDIIRKLGG